MCLCRLLSTLSTQNSPLYSPGLIGWNGMLFGQWALLHYRLYLSMMNYRTISSCLLSLSLSPSPLQSGNPERVSPPTCKKCSLSDCEHDDATHHISNTRGARLFDANSRSCFEIKPSVASMSDAAMATITSLEHHVKAMHDAMAQLTSTIQALVDRIPTQPLPLASSNLQVSPYSAVL